MLINKKNIHMSKKHLNRICAVIAVWLCVAFHLSAQLSVDRIKQLTLPGVEIKLVEQIPAGDYTVPGQRTPMKDMPEFVRISLVSKPAPESHIRIEVWLPKDWNGRYLGAGNAGAGGGLPFGSLELGVRYGFAVATTDMGSWLGAGSLEHKPDRWIDFGYRATREMTVAAKTFINEYYGRAPKYSYLFGSSTGGRQSLMHAQRYPDDYDGVLCGAPALNSTHLHSSLLWIHQLFNEKPGTYLTEQQAEALTDAVMKKNAGKDGGHPDDTYLNDPRMASINPDELEFLSPDQKSIMKKIYKGPVNPVTNEPFYTPIAIGSEYAKSIGLVSLQDSVSELLYLFFPFQWVLGAEFDAMKFDFDKDLDRLNVELAPIMNATNPDLTPFKAKGGKMIMYAGASDPLTPFQDAVLYYDRVIDHFGSVEKVHDFYRFFLVPGLNHNNGGRGPCNIGQRISDPSLSAESNVFTALIRWVEEGTAPDKIICSKWDVPFSMPVYPYPTFTHLIPGREPGIVTNYKAVEHERGLVVVPAPRYMKN
jgi:feruloyl esterase